METKELEYLIKTWRDRAQNDFLQTYNRGKAEGLEEAALELESFIELKNFDKAIGYPPAPEREA